jgi:hypothetical protein
MPVDLSASEGKSNRWEHTKKTKIGYVEASLAVFVLLCLTPLFPHLPANTLKVAYQLLVKVLAEGGSGRSRIDD